MASGLVPTTASACFTQPFWQTKKQGAPDVALPIILRGSYCLRLLIVIELSPFTIVSVYVASSGRFTRRRCAGVS